MSFHYFLNTYLDGVEETAAESARNFKQAMNNKEPNSLNSIQECCASRESAEGALDALHTEAIETELDKLARLEAAAQPAPWRLHPHFVRNLLDAKGEKIVNQRDFVVALRNAAPKLIFQAKNIANIVSDLDEVHAALGTDYNSQAAPDVRTLKYRVKSLRRTLTIWLDKIGGLRKTVKDLEEQRVKDVQKIEVLNKSLETEQTINENLRGTVAELRHKVECNGNLEGLIRSNRNQAETIQDLMRQNEGLKAIAQIGNLPSIHLQQANASIKLLREECAKLRALKEAKQDQRDNAYVEIKHLQERERQLLSSLASVRRQNDNLCAANLERFERIKQLGRDLSAERSEKTRLQGLLDLAKKQVEVFKTCWKPRLSESSFLHSSTGKIVQNLHQALGKPVRCSDGTVRILLCVCGSGYNYKYAPPESNGDCWIDEGGARTLFIGGTILD